MNDRLAILCNYQSNVLPEKSNFKSEGDKDLVQFNPVIT